MPFVFIIICKAANITYLLTIKNYNFKYESNIYLFSICNKRYKENFNKILGLERLL